MFQITLNTKPNFTRPELLLHPPVPPEMHGLTPREMMGQAEWDRIRREAFAKNNHCCWICGVHASEAKYRQWLEGHEIYDVNYFHGVMTLKEVVGVCHLCHQYIHISRAKALTEMGLMPVQKYNDILDHGLGIMNRERPEPWWDYEQMKRDQQEGRKRLPWGSWKLIWDGKEYRSMFRSREDWENHYRRRAKRDD